MSIIPCDMLLHPELLTNEQLQCVIQERHLKIPFLQDMTRDSLLEVFHSYCVPYAQRRCKDNGRGNIRNINKMRSVNAQETLITHVDIVDSVQNRVIRLNTEGLKPPPDLLSGHMKRIKLTTEIDKRSSFNCDVNIIKRNFIGNHMSVDDESPPAKKQRKPITWP